MRPRWCRLISTTLPFIILANPRTLRMYLCSDLELHHQRKGEKKHHTRICGFIISNVLDEGSCIDWPPFIFPRIVLCSIAVSSAEENIIYLLDQIEILDFLHIWKLIHRYSIISAHNKGYLSEQQELSLRLKFPIILSRWKLRYHFRHFTCSPHPHTSLLFPVDCVLIITKDKQQSTKVRNAQEQNQYRTGNEMSYWFLLQMATSL